MGSLNGRKIEAMYRKFGPGPEGANCRTCDNCIRHIPTDHHYWKCTQYGVTSGESTDWRVSWPACGCYNRESGEIPVIEQLKHAPRAVLKRTECDGQITMF